MKTIIICSSGWYLPLLPVELTGIENPVVEVDGNLAGVTYISVLNADIYGARRSCWLGISAED